MSVSISNEHVVDLNNLKSLSTLDVYVKVEVEIDEDGKKRKEIRSVPLCEIFKLSEARPCFDAEYSSDFQATFEDAVNNPTAYYIPATNGPITITGFVRDNAADKTPVLATKAGDKILLMATSDVVSHSLSGEERQYYGLKQRLGLVPTKVGKIGYEDDTKVFIRLAGDHDYIVADAKDIYIFANGVSTNLSQLTDPKILQAIEAGNTISGVRLIYNNRDIETLDNGKFRVGDVVEQESFDFIKDKQGNQTLVHHEFDVDTDKKYDDLHDKYRDQISDTTIVDGYVECQTVETQENGKQIHSRKLGIDTLHEGEYIQVLDLLGNQHIAKLGDLYLSNTGDDLPIDLESFKTISENGCLKYVGQPLWLRQGNSYIELQPLTAERVLKTYSYASPQPTKVDDPSLIGLEGTFRQTKTGEFFEESKIQPLCYDYAPDDADDKSFDKYLFDIGENGKPEYVIVDRTKFNNPSLTIRHNGRAIQLSINGSNPPKKLKRTEKTSEKAAIIQTTTSNNVFENVVVLRTRNDQTLSEQQTQLAKDCYDAFKADYISGKYQVEDCFNEAGKKFTFMQTPSRYVMSDVIVTSDAAAKDTYYQNFKPQTLTLKDGVFQGEATFDRKKANKKYNKEARSVAGVCFSLMASPIGFLSMFVFPVLPLAGIGALASIPVANVVNAIRQNASKARIANVKNPMELSRANAEKELLAEMAKVTKDFTEVFNRRLAASKAKYREQKREFNREARIKRGTSQPIYNPDPRYVEAPNFDQSERAEIDVAMIALMDVERRIEAAFEPQKLPGCLHVVNGKAEINGTNAYLAQEYQKLLADKNNKIKLINKQLKKATGNERQRLQSELEGLILERDSMMSDYVMTHKDIPADNTEKERCLKFLNYVRGLMVGIYNDELLRNSRQVDNSILSKLSFDCTNMMYVYNNKKYKSVEDIMKANPSEAKSIEETIGKLTDYGSSKWCRPEFKDVNGKVIKPVDPTAQTAAEQDKKLISEMIDKKEKENDLDQQKDLEQTDEFELVLSLLQKDNLTKDDQDRIDKYFASVGAEAQQLQTHVQAITQVATTQADTTTKDEISALVDTIKKLNKSLTSCNEKISKLSNLLSTKNMSDAHKQQVEENIAKLQAMVSSNQDQISQALEIISLKLQAAKNSGIDIEDEEFKQAWQTLKKETFKIQVQPPQTEDIDFKKRFIDTQQEIVNQSVEALERFESLTNNDALNKEKFEELKQKILAKNIYGTKTILDKTIKNLTVLSADLIEQDRAIKSKVETLEQVKAHLADDQDEKLIKIREQADEKIKDLQEKSAKLAECKQKIAKLQIDYANLKAYVDVLSIMAAAQKILESEKLNSKLQANATDVAFLAEIIASIKNLVKLKKVLAEANIQINEDVNKYLQSIQAKLPEQIDLLQQFVRQNYNVYNKCSDFAVRDKYYKKIAGYSDIDHSVEFSLPESGANQEDGLKN